MSATIAIISQSGKRILDPRSHDAVAVSLASLLPWLGRDANQSGWQASFARGVLLVGPSIVKAAGFGCVSPADVSRNCYCTGAIRIVVSLKLTGGQADGAKHIVPIGKHACNRWFESVWTPSILVGARRRGRRDRNHLRCHPSTWQSCSRAPAFAWPMSHSNPAVVGDFRVRPFSRRCASTAQTRAGRLAGGAQHRGAWRLVVTSTPWRGEEESKSKKHR